MKMPNPKWKDGDYWYRRRVPKDVRATYGKGEEWEALRTRDPAEAKRRLFDAQLLSRARRHDDERLAIMVLLERLAKAMTRLWAKREAQIQGVIESTVGMYGDLQGIAGRVLPELEGLDLPLLEEAVPT